MEERAEVNIRGIGHGRFEAGSDRWEEKGK
nr:hypothetical protein 158p1_00134 [Serratia entomophila]ULG14705.1 hypothetical protein 145p_00021 [Serratia proteamaculans]ULG10535.1 hypothetical protein 176p_00134 [Serratia entomophila]ULG11376.1 hypothetical protein 398p_00024 [Serratia entomophila]ULG11755.1 hypothetical protein 626p_00126 [Serratia entomophila]